MPGLAAAADPAWPPEQGAAVPPPVRAGLRGPPRAGVGGKSGVKGGTGARKGLSAHPGLATTPSHRCRDGSRELGQGRQDAPSKPEINPEDTCTDPPGSISLQCAKGYNQRIMFY